jgi:hypothetical protein
MKREPTGDAKTDVTVWPRGDLADKQEVGAYEHEERHHHERKTIAGLWCHVVGERKRSHRRRNRASAVSFACS